VKFKMARNSIFAILLRSRWWVSFAIAAALVLVGRALLPQFGPLVAFPAIPFVIVGAIAAWKQLRQPSPARVQQTLEAVTAMAWPTFADALEAALMRDGGTVKRLPGPAADFEVTAAAGGLTLVSGRRWKAARIGTEPLRALQAAMSASGARAGLVVALGEPSDAATAFAREQGIEFLRGAELAALLSRQSLRPKR
jgi:restriction system protein